MTRQASIVVVIAALLFCVTTQPSWANDGLRVFYTYEQESLGKILQGFGAGAKIAVQSDFRAQSDLKPTLLAMGLAQLPDAIIMPADHVGIHTYIKYSVIDPALFKSKLPERVWASAFSDGHLYGVPLIQGNHLMLFYNKSLVKKPARDWQALALQKAELDAKGLITIAWNYDEPYYFLPFLGAFGGWPLNNGKPELNNPAMISAIDFYSHIKKLRHPDCLSACARELFKAGKAAYVISGVWDGINFQQALGENLGLSAIPKAKDRTILSPFSTHVIAFPNDSLNSKKRAQLIQLVDYLHSPKIQRQLWDQTGAIPVELSSFDYAQKNAKGYMKQTLELLVDTKAVPADQSMSVVWDAISKGMARHRAGLINAEEAALYMQDLADRYIRSMQRLSKRQKRRTDSQSNESSE